MGGEGSDELPLESYEGEGLEIGFNASYFLEVLKYMPTESVKMTFKAAEKAAKAAAEAEKTPEEAPAEAAEEAPDSEEEAAE